MKLTSILSVCILALATAVSANSGQFEHNSVGLAHTKAPADKPAHHWDARETRKHHQAHSRDAGRYQYTHAEAPANMPTHHWAARDFREHQFASHNEMKPTATRHHARNVDEPTSHSDHYDVEDEKDEEFKPVHHFPARDARERFEPKPTGARNWVRAIFKGTTKPEAGKPGRHFARDMDRDIDRKPKHSDDKPTHHFARDAADHPADKFEPIYTGGAVAGKPGHHHVRSAGRPTFKSNAYADASHPTSNPYAGTTFTPGSAISSVRGILVGGTGLKRTCDRCVAAMQVGQSLATQSSVSDFSSAVIGLCQQVKYKSDSGCTSAFGPEQVGPYIQTLANANIATDGKSFCKAYFNAC